MRITALILGFTFALATACGGNVCDELADKANACFASSQCDSMPSCAAAKADRGSGEGAACEGPFKALAEACDQSTITPENNCACSLN